jgi:hypothetical protein
MTDAELIKCAERELAMRKRVYPRRVADGKMPAAVAEHETKAMGQIVEILRNRTAPTLGI